MYYLEHFRKGESINATEKANEMLWHQRYGHVGEQTLKVCQMVNWLNVLTINLLDPLVFVRAVSVESNTKVSPFDCSEGNLLELDHSEIVEN